MGQSYRWKRESGLVNSNWGLALTAVLLLIGLPGQAMAESCNSSLQYIIDGPSGDHWFVDDILTVKAALGAGSIAGGTNLQIPNFGYGMNCQEDPTGLTYANCDVPPNSLDPDFAPVEYLGVVESSITCENSEDQKITFLPLEANKVEIKPTNGPIELDPNQSCMIAWKFAVRDLPVGEINHRFHQVVSFPVEGESAACDNGLTTSQSRSGWIDIDTCGIDVQKQICSPDTSDCTEDENWYDADTQNDALQLSPDGLAAYRAIITNTGSVDYVDDIAVVDELLDIDIEINGLAAGESVIIGGSEALASWAHACSNTIDIQNTLQVTAQCRAGNDPVFAEDSNQAWGDCKNFFVPFPNVSIEKSTNGEDADSAPGPTVPVGSQVSWSYVVTNQGNIPLTNVTVTDSDQNLTVSCPRTTLDATGPDSSMTCTASGTATLGQYANIGTVNASSAAGPASATDPSHYFGVGGGVDIEKYTNGVDADDAPGPSITVGEEVTWTYVVTNTGDLPLRDVFVTDDQVGAISCPRTTLDVTGPNSSMTCTASGTATLGQYANIGTVNATSTAGPASATDPSHYFGVSGGVDIEKYTNGSDADTAPGPSITVGEEVTWTYVVTNTGDLPLTDVVVTDDQVGAISCPRTTLDATGPDSSMTCTASGTATLGQYANIGTVNATSTAGPVSATDPSHYFGVGGSVDIEKYTNGVDADVAPGPSITVGEEVTWTYVVTNTGDLPLTDVVVTDDQVGAISCPRTTLDATGPDSSMTCTASGTATPGQYANIGTVNATSAAGPVSATDPSHYTGKTTVITVTKRVENVTLKTDGSLDVEYWVTVNNSGDLQTTYDLKDNLAVDEALIPQSVASQVAYEKGTEDSRTGTLGTPSIADFTSVAGATLVTAEDLAAGKNESFRFTINFTIDGTSTTLEGANCEDDEDDNTGLTNEVRILVGGEEVDNATACEVFPLNPAIDVEKEISIDGGQNFSDSEGPAEPPVDAIYRIRVRNTGNIDLEQVTISDTKIPGGDYTFGPLRVSDGWVSIEFDAGPNGAWPELKFDEICTSSANITNVVTATGEVEIGGQQVTDTDSANLVCKGDPLISIIKEVSVDGGPWWNANTDNPPVDEFPMAIFDPDSDVPAEYRFKVANIGTTDLENVTITDTNLDLTAVPISDLPQGGPVVTITSSDAGFENLSVSGICPTIGPVANLASVTGESTEDSRTDTDTDPATVRCVGGPEISIKKYVSATGAADDWHDDSDSGVAVSDVFYKIVVENTGAFDLANVTVTDEILGLTRNVGSMAPGDIVTYVPENPGAGETLWSDLKLPGFCDRTLAIDNTAMVSGDVVGDNQTVTAQDDAFFTCTLSENLCIPDGRPSRLWMLYDGDDDTSYPQEMGSVTINPAKQDNFPDGPVTIRVYGGPGGNIALLDEYYPIYRNDPFLVDDESDNLKLPPFVRIEVWDGDTLLQTIFFHGSCSEPLISGAELGAVTIWYAEWGPISP